MGKFFVLPQQISNGIIHIEGGDALHIGKVLRLAVGDTITVCDGAGVDYEAKIQKMQAQKVQAKIVDCHKSDTEPTLQVVLYQGIPKGTKMDFVIQKAVELGVSQIVPVVLKRTVVKLDAKGAAGKVARWNKIAAEASKQCNRAVIPQVAPVVTLDEALGQMKQQLKLIPYEAEEKKGLRDVLQQYQQVSSVGVLIGPEGGFDRAEVEQAVGAGLLPVRLGKRILRTETAPLAVIAALMYAYGELN